MFFGQLGNDWMQGDGSIIDDTGAITIDVVGTRESKEDWAGAGRPTPVTGSKAAAATTRSSAASARTT